MSSPQQRNALIQHLSSRAAEQTVVVIVELLRMDYQRNLERLSIAPDAEAMFKIQGECTAIKGLIDAITKPLPPKQ